MIQKILQFSIQPYHFYSMKILFSIFYLAFKLNICIFHVFIFQAVTLGHHDPPYRPNEQNSYRTTVTGVSIIPVKGTSSYSTFTWYWYCKETWYLLYKQWYHSSPTVL